MQRSVSVPAGQPASPVAGRTVAAAGGGRPLDAALAGASRIAVLRALQLGDLLCAVPALRALRAAAPRASIALIGLPWARAFVARFSDHLDEFIELPGWPGLPERALDLAAVPPFLADAQARRFDLAIQLHGSGGIVNELTILLGARANAGFFVPGQWCPDAQRFIAWPDQLHEIERHLALTAHLGAPSQGTHLEFPITAQDRLELQAGLAAETAAAATGNATAPTSAAGAADAEASTVRLVRSLAPGRYAVVHAGSQLPSRRWSPQRFGQVACTLIEAGLTVVLTGTAAERPLAEQVASALGRPCLNLAGRTTLGAVAALIAEARLLLSNDTGVSHIAAALATPSVVVCSGADAARWAPLDAARHRVLFHPVPCRPCAHAVCPIGHPCAEGVTVDAVAREARWLLERPDHRPMPASCAA